MWYNQTMALNQSWQTTINELKQQYDSLKKGKESLLELLFEAELPESVYNSNAIENSTLTIAETEQILLELEVARKISLREVFEAKNLARVFNYVKTKLNQTELNEELILFLHRMLMSGIDDEIAGRFRESGEYVRVGSHLAPAPEHVSALVEAALLDYSSDFTSHFIEKIARFHLEFETTHPFNDGNGRIGRVLINYQLMELGFPPLIIRDKEKADYYQTFKDFRSNNQTESLEKILYLGLLESLHKRLAYLKSEQVIDLADYAKNKRSSTSSILNKAKRQTIPAFREKGVWRIGISEKQAKNKKALS